MKSLEEIKEKIEEIKKDERLGYPPANIFVNPPLALVQVNLESFIQALEWVLSENKDIGKGSGV